MIPKIIIMGKNIMVVVVVVRNTVIIKNQEGLMAVVV